MRVRFDRDSHSGVPPACRDRPRVCPPLTRQDEICYAVGRPNWHGARTDTGSVPTCGLTPELVSVVYYPLTPRRLKQILKPNSRSFSSRLWENVPQIVSTRPTSWKASRRLFRLVQLVGRHLRNAKPLFQPRDELFVHVELKDGIKGGPQTN